MPAKKGDEFFSDLIEALQQQTLKQIKEMRWVEAAYPRMKVSEATIEEAFAKIDHSKIIAAFTENIEDRLAKQLFNSLETEITNDIKLALSNKALRHGVRMAASIAIRDFIKKATEEA